MAGRPATPALDWLKKVCDARNLPSLIFAIRLQGDSLYAGEQFGHLEIMLLVRSYGDEAGAVARHLDWPEARVQAAINYAEAFPEEINEAMAENESADFEALKRMLPQTAAFRTGRR